MHSTHACVPQRERALFVVATAAARHRRRAIWPKATNKTPHALASRFRMHASRAIARTLFRHREQGH